MFQNPPNSLIFIRGDQGGEGGPPKCIACTVSYLLSGVTVVSVV